MVKGNLVGSKFYLLIVQVIDTKGYRRIGFTVLLPFFHRYFLSLSRLLRANSKSSIPLREACKLSDAECIPRLRAESTAFRALPSVTILSVSWMVTMEKIVLWFSFLLIENLSSINVFTRFPWRFIDITILFNDIKKSFF